MVRKGILFILVGPSGAGKNTLMKRVQQQITGLPQLATATTRAKRPDEQEGREHRFVTRAEFQNLIDTGALIEYEPVHSGNLYGTPRDTVENALERGSDLIADIEFVGAGKIHDAYPDNTVLIFVTPSSLEYLDDRIRQRGDITPGDLASRLARVRFEMTFARRAHYLITNDHLEPAAEHLRQIILSERARRRGESADGLILLHRPTRHNTVIALVRSGDVVLARYDQKILTFPRFALENTANAPHEMLQNRVRAALSPAITIDALCDTRFEFTAPHHVDTAAIPNDVYIDFYYRCTLPAPIALPGWEWLPVAELELPAALREVLRPDSSI